MSDRQPPHNVEAERAVLGSVLLKPAIWPTVAALLLTNEFYLPAHREVFEAMGRVSKREMPIDVVSVGDELKARGALPRLEGGEAYLLTLAGSVPTAENFEHYVKLVRNASNLRRVIELCAYTAAKAYTSTDAKALLDAHGTALSRIAVQTGTEASRIGEVIPEVLADIEQRAANGVKGIISGVRTGVEALDRLLLGLNPEELHIFGGDPGSGKTALAIQAGIDLALEGGLCYCANLEMSKKQLAERALVRQARLNSYWVRAGKLEYSEFRELTAAAGKLYDKNFYIDTEVSTVAQFAARARALRIKHPDVKMLGIFDYLQLGDPDDDNDGTQSQQVGEMAKGLKSLARSLKIPVIAMSSLNRSQKDQNQPPNDKSLRESGAIAFHADGIVLFWNPDKTKDGEMQLIVCKNRNGPGGMVKAHWEGRYFSFRDVDGYDAQRELGGTT